jgi:hypothetical protein
VSVILLMTWNHVTHLSSQVAPISGLAFRLDAKKHRVTKETNIENKNERTSRKLAIQSLLRTKKGIASVSPPSLLCRNPHPVIHGTGLSRYCRCIPDVFL